MFGNAEVEMMDDTVLVERFKVHGDKRAFEAILSKYENQVYRFGYRMCGHPQDAEDIVQDTFESAYRYLKDFRGEASLLSWLLKIASSACIKKRRLRKDQPKNLLSYEALQEVGGAEVELATPQAETPADQIVASEMKKKLEELLHTIPEHYRIVLVLRDIEGVSSREAAEALDISETAAKVRLHRARAMLFKKFEEVYHGQVQERRATSL